MESKISTSVNKVRQSWGVIVGTFFLPMILVNWSPLVTTAFQNAMQDMWDKGVPIDPASYWLAINGDCFTSAVAALIGGFWINTSPIRPMMIFFNMILSLLCICVLVSPVAPLFAVMQVFYGFWQGLALVCILSYLTRVTSVQNRNLVMIAALVFSNSVAPDVVTAVQTGLTQTYGECPGVKFSIASLLIMLLVSSFLYFLMTERPIENALGSLLMRNRLQTFGAVFKRFFRFSEAAVPLRAIGSCILLASSAFFGYAVYMTLLMMTFDELHLNLAEQLWFVYGGLGATLIYMVVLMLLSSRVGDRALLAGNAVVMAAGYGLTIPWGGDYSLWRYISGSLLIAFADNGVLALSTSLFSKIVSQDLVPAWMGVMVFFNQGLLGIPAVWAAPGPLSMRYNIASFVLITLSLLLIIPTYSHLLPSLFSPWSGGALPVQMDEKSDLLSSCALESIATDDNSSSSYIARKKKAGGGSSGALTTETAGSGTTVSTYTVTDGSSLVGSTRVSNYNSLD